MRNGSTPVIPEVALTTAAVPVPPWAIQCQNLIGLILDRRSHFLRAARLSDTSKYIGGAGTSELVRNWFAIGGSRLLFSLYLTTPHDPLFLYDELGMSFVFCVAFLLSHQLRYVGDSLQYCSLLLRASRMTLHYFHTRVS